VKLTNWSDLFWVYGVKRQSINDYVEHYLALRSNNELSVKKIRKGFYES